MANAFDFTEEEVMKIFYRELNAPSIEAKMERKRNRIRKAKADFCNLKAQPVVF